MPWIFDSAPSPFSKKVLAGTPINKAHPLSSGLILCWALTEGRGTYLVESAWGGSGFAMRWGADTALGTGADAPAWTYFDKALGLRLPQGTPSGTNIQIISPVYSFAGSKMRPFGDFRRGFSLEFWGKPTGDPTRSSGMMRIERAVGGQFMRFGLIGPTIDFRLSGGPGPGFIQSPTYANFGVMGNHFVATVTQKGEAHIYMNGRNVATGALSYLTDEMNIANIAWDGNVLHDRFTGVFYKASVYNLVLGPAAVLALSINPMAMFSVDYPAAISEPAPEPPPPGGLTGETNICDLVGAES